MKKALLIIGLLASSLTLAACSKPASTDTTAKVDTNTLVAGTNYQEYSVQATQKAQAEGKEVALFFHSKTCSSCAALNTDIVANTKDIPTDVAIFKVDWDENQALAKEYKVDSYHTVRFLDQEKNVKGVFKLDDLLAEFNNTETKEEPVVVEPVVVVEEDTIEVIEDSEVEETETETEPTQEEPTQEKAIASTLQPYETYSEEKVATATQEGKRVVLNFKASRCPTCKATTDDILANINQLPEDVIILETDYDTYKDLKKEYGVVRQTTFVFLDTQGDYVKTVENVRSMKDVLSNI